MPQTSELSFVKGDSAEQNQSNLIILSSLEVILIKWFDRQSIKVTKRSPITVGWSCPEVYKMPLIHC